MDSKKINTLLLVIIAALLGSLIFVVSNKDSDVDHMMMNSSTGVGNLSGADVMFLQMMIPHHQQAIDMSELAVARTTNSDLLNLAQRIIKAQSAEIVQMRDWLKSAGASEDMGHHMSGMGGMLSTDEMTALKNATGQSFDILWLQGMIGHHDGALHMTSMIVDADNPDIKAFGANIIKVQTAEIAEMKDLLK